MVSWWLDLSRCGSSTARQNPGDYLTLDGKGVIFYKSEGDRDIRSCGVDESLGGEGVNCLLVRSHSAV